MADWGPQTVNLTRDCDDIHRNHHRHHPDQRRIGIWLLHGLLILGKLDNQNKHYLFFMKIDSK